MKAILLTVFVAGAVFTVFKQDLTFQPQKEIQRQDKDVATLKDQTKALDLHKQAVEAEVSRVKERAEELARLESERKAREDAAAAAAAAAEAKRNKRHWYFLWIW